MSDPGLPFDDSAQKRLSDTGRAAMSRARRRLSGDEWIALLRQRLAAYRRAQVDFSVPSIAVAELRQLDRQLEAAGSFAGKEGHVLEKLRGELHDEIAKAVPKMAQRPRNWA